MNVPESSAVRHPELRLDVPTVPITRVRSILGEGPVWADEHLIWVDIVEGTVHWKPTPAGTEGSLAVSESVGAAVPRRDGSLVLATRSGFYSTDADRRSVSKIASVEEDIPGNRMNDGKCDSRGRFWAGTQADDLSPGVAALYRLELDGSVTTVLSGVSIANGLAWSPDDTLFYFIDTAERSVDVFDYDAESGDIDHRRRLIDFPAGAGEPDGMTVDADGHLWVAMWEGWSLLRFAPTGALVAALPMPVSNVTSCTFGGPDLSTLYVTSAAMDPFEPFDETRLRAEPLAGQVFAIPVGVRGLPVFPCKVRVRPGGLDG